MLNVESTPSILWPMLCYVEMYPLHRHKPRPKQNQKMFRLWTSGKKKGRHPGKSCNNCLCADWGPIHKGENSYKQTKKKNLDYTSFYQKWCFPHIKQICRAGQVAYSAVSSKEPWQSEFRARTHVRATHIFHTCTKQRKDSEVDLRAHWPASLTNQWAPGSMTVLTRKRN